MELDAMSFQNAPGVPDANSDEGVHFVKENNGLITTYLVSGGERYLIADGGQFGVVTYGREWLRGKLDPIATRWIGDTIYQTNSVILNDFKVAKVRDGEVIATFNQTNWFLIKDGSPSNVIWENEADDDGSDIMLVNTRGFWYIGGGTNPTYERHIVSLTPFTYDGDVAQYIKPFGMSVDFAVSKGGKQRCIHDLTTMGSRLAGLGGSQYMLDRGGWASIGMSRFSAESQARNKNADSSRNVPYCNEFQLDLKVWHSLQIIKYGTKDLHAQDVCGKGISANDSTPTAGTWGTMTGIRIKRDGVYSYYKTDSSVLRASGGGGTAYNFHQVLCNYRPVLQIAEMQLVLSHAVQNGISQNQQFQFRGHSYTYENVSGSKGVADGEMTARVRKFFTTEFTGYDSVAQTDVEGLELEWCLEQTVLNGRVIDWGHLYRWVSGMDRLIDGSDNNMSYLYQTDDVEKVTTDSETDEFDLPYRFAFQEVYDLVGTLAYGNGYSLEMHPNSLWTKAKGAGIHTGECAYLAFAGAPSAGKVSRRGVFSRGSAYVTVCSSRLSNSYFAPTHTLTHLGFGFRVTLPQSGA